MPQSSDERDREIRILELAVERGTLAADQFRTIIEDGDDGLCDLAIRQNLLTVADVDLLRPLSDPHQFIPGYEIIELIGEGAIGAVYRARQTKLNRMVALKLLKRSALENQIATARSSIEAQVGAQLHHPNIVAVYDYGVQHGQIYLAMELVKGQSLLELIESRSRLDSRLALSIVRQVISALSHAAEHSVVHRDIKPANLLVTDRIPGLTLPAETPAVLVSDFGLASHEQAEDAARLTASGTTLGTPCYVAPEQLASSDVDCRADIYSLGASLYHMLNGEPPFAGANPLMAIVTKMQGREEWRRKMQPDIAPNVRQLILDMTTNDPADRIQNYATLEARVDQLLNDPDLSTTQTMSAVILPQRHRQRLGRLTGRRLRWLITAMAVVGLIAGAIQSGLFFHAAPVKAVVERGRVHALFQGLSTPKGRQIGEWKPTEDAESGYVLAGTNGWKKLAFPSFESGQAEFFEFRVDVNLIGEAITDVCFAAAPSGECQIVRLTKQSAMLGSGQVEHDEFKRSESGKRLLFPAKQDGVRYRRITVSRQNDGWFIHVNSEQLGAVRVDSDTAPAVVLRAIAGTVHFANIEVYETHPVTPPVHGPTSNQLEN